MSKVLLKVSGVSKSFGHVQALKDVNFELNEGEVLGLVGDNGAGKSTFIKILSGVHRKDKGEIIFDGDTVDFSSPSESIEAGFETVYQDLALAPDLPIYSNMFLGREMLRKGILGKLGFVDKDGMRKSVEKNIKKLKATLNHVDQEVGTLSGGQRQSVAITRAVIWGKKVIIMDEPTAALGVEESAKVLEIVKELKQHGITVIFISHTMPHVLEVSDKICVLRLGFTVANLNAAETTYEEVVEYITGARSQIEG
ncbi:MAG: sugar ABC transporter ATP-binding protein [Sphaerochaetaceae bacterium]|nr:sugar ABC transporter ATP-binding protein [Sphaerochaetaceae bacterium]